MKYVVETVHGMVGVMTRPKHGANFWVLVGWRLGQNEMAAGNGEIAGASGARLGD